MWMCFCPGKRLLFGIKKPIDDNRVALGRTPPARACGFAIDHISSGVYGNTGRITKEHFAAIGNFLWIDSAMPCAQLLTVPRRMLA
jgi:hypothetical protein